MKQLAIFLALCSPAFADKPTSVKLDAPGECVTVALEGKVIRLMLREAAPAKAEYESREVVTTDSSVRLNRRQAQQIADLLDDAIRKAGGPVKEETASNASLFHLVAQCEGGQCRAPSAPRAAVARPAPAVAPVRRGFCRAWRPLGRVFCRGCR